MQAPGDADAGDGAVPNKYMAVPIYGPVICNEDKDGVEDSTLEDYRVVLNKVYDY